MKLNESEIAKNLETLPGWSVRKGSLVRLYEFKGFAEAVAFVDRIAQIAQRHNHHPDIDIRWNKVTLALVTHDEGGITGKDFLVAEECEQVYKTFKE